MMIMRFVFRNRSYNQTERGSLGIDGNTCTPPTPADSCDLVYPEEDRAACRAGADIRGKAVQVDIRLTLG